MQIAQVSVPIVFPFPIDRANGSTKTMSDSNFHVVLLVTWDGTCEKRGMVREPIIPEQTEKAAIAMQFTPHSTFKIARGVALQP